jgi:RNA polymerase sigma-70 factor, ECF subfamily
MNTGVAVDQERPGVASSFEDFFRSHLEKVARAAALVTGDPTSGQDSAQEAFLRLYERWDAMGSDAHARNFVFKVALNLARSQRRAHLRIVRSGLHHADHVPSLENTMREEWHEVARALATLPARQRACVVLIDYADMDSEGAGRALGIRPATVRVHLMRGRKALRTHLGMHAEGGQER